LHAALVAEIMNFETYERCFLLSSPPIAAPDKKMR